MHALEGYQDWYYADEEELWEEDEVTTTMTVNLFKIMGMPCHPAAAVSGPDKSQRYTRPGGAEERARRPP